MTSQFFSSLLAGAAAGISVDVALFPIDTIKCRMQAPEGFLKSGGFKGLYNGLGAAALGSAPGAAAFFCGYDLASAKFLKELKRRGIKDQRVEALSYMAASSIGEVIACLVRVPTENVKQKQQAGLYTSLRSTVRGIINEQGFRGFYAGYSTTVAREIPFSFIQFPIWEFSKQYLRKKLGKEISPWQSALCGSASGAVAAAITTPLDVVKSRQMLDIKTGKYAGKSMVSCLKTIHTEEGVPGLFKGVTPRTMWIGIGGFIFFYAYSTVKDMTKSDEDDDKGDGF